ncbi:FRG domain-containing protein [Roseivirga sp. E12]|uniref:FRG domain-containing protein n=1 Tax=Roseivirga sp. E12 TaxID=2819237 RepID=UPI001ABD26EF|nr:FRG domain-containing protein [Roseivirga sp. E12]MBO3697467.1 FRG domain-containing protein [Roseivirga sp. E12]
MKKYASNLYGELDMPEDFIELTQLMLRKDLHRKSGSETLRVRYWRGQSNVNWRLDSGAYRRVQRDLRPGQDVNDEIRNYETRLLDYATHQGYRYHEGRDLSDFELLAKLQHHGAATRLIDFSCSALTALWFCVSSLPDDMGLLIGLNTRYIGGGEKQVHNLTYEEIISACDKYTNPSLWDSPSTTSRISAQNAQFIYSKIGEHKAGSLMTFYEGDVNSFIPISPKLKVECSEILSNVYNIRKSTLFPDIDGFGAANAADQDQWNMTRW